MMRNKRMVRQALPFALGVLVSCTLSYYFKLPELFWSAITAILVMQTSDAVVLRQGLERFMLILLGVGLGTLLVLKIKFIFLLKLFAILLYAGANYINAKRSWAYSKWTLLFVLAFLLACIVPSAEPNLVYLRLYEVTLGAGVGILMHLIISPFHVDKTFRESVIPILKCYKKYLNDLMNLLYREQDAKVQVEKTKVKCEKLLSQEALFPIWVYESGFSVVFQQGHRHFLVMIERVGQILFSINHLVRHSFDELFLQGFRTQLFDFVKQTEDIIDAFIKVLNLKNLTEGIDDLSTVLENIESTFKKQVPLSLEALDISKDYIYFSALIQNLQDLQLALIRLGQSLRQTRVPSMG